MKISEFKIRALNTATSLIDTYFGGSGMTEKFINSTLKLILKQNIHKLDDMLVLFADKDGEINANDVINEYANMVGEEGFVFDLKQYVPNEMVRSMIPDKILIIKKDDIMSILR
jgi:hypothetical protein